jgi:glycosyltransferase involved in cell wall biosynthesis
MTAASPAVLYISYDGILEPLGQSQVLAYLERLATDYRIHLVSFEKTADWQKREERGAVAARIRAAGIHWHPRRYHKQPSGPATAWDMLVGIASGVWLVWTRRLCIVHARSYVPAAMAVAIRRVTRARFLFDMRGFWADERADAGQWSRNGRMYRVAKRSERRFLLHADHVVSLTAAAVRLMQGFDYLQGHTPPMTVIPTCADLARFAPRPRQARPRFVVGYVGTASGWYRFDAAARCFRECLALCPGARFLIVNRGEHDFIRARLAEAGVPDDCIELKAVAHAQVPEEMAWMDVAVFFTNESISHQARAPTRLAEFLGCGIPCLGNTGVGDMAEVLEGERVGVAVTEFDDDSLRAGIQRLLALMDEPGLRERCVAAAHRHFSLDDGVRRYAEIYRSLLRAR